MTHIFIFFIFVTCALLESMVLQFPFTVIFLSALSFYQYRLASRYALIAGLVLDLFSARLLGLSSIVFLMSFLVWDIFSQKIQAIHIIYRGIYLLLFLFFYHLFSYHTVVIPIFFRDAVVGFTILLLMFRLISLPHIGRLKV